MLDKSQRPSKEEIKKEIGKIHAEYMDLFESFLNDNYDLITELKFPFGNKYGWSYKYSHKNKHSCYLFFEGKAFTICIQIGKNELNKINDIFETFLPRTKEVWKNRYPCGDGGWMYYRILKKEELDDVIKLITTKKKPINQIQEKLLT